MRLVTFLDEETTGKLHPDHRIIELSLRQFDLDTEEEKRNLLLRFNPERNIDAKAFAVHGIALDELKTKPVIAKCFPQIIKVLKESHLIVAHNGGGPDYEGGFDYPFLKMEAERNGFELPDTKWFDTMVEGTFATDLGKSPRLEELCFALDVDYDSRLAHKGDYDTEVNAQAFFKGVRHGWFIV
jgi:DNA polymerase-3 subunit epsilon